MKVITSHFKINYLFRYMIPISQLQIEPLFDCAKYHVAYACCLSLL